MNRWGRIVTGAAAAVTLLLCATPGTAAADDAVALNGTYTVVSDGQWAKTNYRYHDEATVTQTWTITSSCATFQDCTGRVVSDAGWSADAVYASGRWRVRAMRASTFRSTKWLIAAAEPATKAMPSEPNSRISQGTMPGVASNMPTMAVKVIKATTRGLVNSR